MRAVSSESHGPWSPSWKHVTDAKFGLDNGDWCGPSGRVIPVLQLPQAVLLPPSPSFSFLPNCPSRRHPTSAQPYPSLSGCLPLPSLGGGWSGLGWGAGRGRPTGQSPRGSGIMWASSKCRVPIIWLLTDMTLIQPEIQDNWSYTVP